MMSKRIEKLQIIISSSKWEFIKEFEKLINQDWIVFQDIQFLQNTFICYLTKVIYVNEENTEWRDCGNK